VDEHDAAGGGGQAGGRPLRRAAAAAPVPAHGHRDLRAPGGGGVHCRSPPFRNGGGGRGLAESTQLVLPARQGGRAGGEANGRVAS
jgi:hypothetical protein